LYLVILSLLVRAFLVYVRPVLERNFVLCSQRHFTKRLRGFRHLCYADRLTNLDLPSLELRQLDRIYCYNIVLDLCEIKLC